METIKMVMVFHFQKKLGVDPKTNKPITIKQGPYGIYIEMEDKEGEKPSRASMSQKIYH